MKTYKNIVQCGADDLRKMLLQKEQEEISGVVNVAWNVNPPIAHDAWRPVLWQPYHDEKTPEVDWFKPIIAFYELWSKSGKVVIHCQAGGNRSRGTFGVLLVACHGMTAQEAIKITGQPGYSAWRIAIENQARHLGR